MTATKSLVPLEEVAGQFGGSPEVVLARLDLGGHPAPTPDWKGDPCIPADVAARLVGDHQAEVEQYEARKLAYEAYVAEHSERRRAAGAEAFEKAQREAHEDELRSIAVDFAGFVGQVPVENAHTKAAGREAQREVLNAFDAKHPLTPFEKFKG
jgi:hypothetical protein